MNIVYHVAKKELGSEIIFQIANDIKKEKVTETLTEHLTDFKHWTNFPEDSSSCHKILLWRQTKLQLFEIG